MTRPQRLGPWIVRAELGLVAFAPAMGLLAARARGETVWLIGFGAPAALGLLVGVWAGWIVHRANPEPVEFADISDASDEVVGHVGSYLVPIVVDVSGSTEQAAIAAIALALIIHIHIATGRVHVNPLLYLVGYRTYRATSMTGVTYYLLARSDVSTWAGSRRLVPLGAAVLVERTKDARARRDRT